MSWNAIIGQDKVKNILQRSIIENRIANSYCFWGPDGVGKDSVALQFAKVINCSDPIIKEHSIDSCEICQSCKQFKILQHPNLDLVFSLPTGKTADTKSDSAYAKLSDEQIEEIQDELAVKASNHYHRINITGANQIRITSVREIKKTLSLSANQAGRRFIIVFRADELSSESANAFLKTLEEPNLNITIIIITSKKDTILPTILSRCQMIYFPPLSDEELMKYLSEKNGLDTSEAKIISAFAQGSITRANDFFDEDIKEMRELMVISLRAALKKKNYKIELWNSLENVASVKDKSKHELYLNLLFFWISDAISIHFNNTQKIINIDHLQSISRFSENFFSENIYKVLNLVEASLIKVKRNVQPKLIYLNLMINIRKLLINK